MKKVVVHFIAVCCTCAALGAPTIQSISPPPESAVGVLSQIAVTFSEPIVGIEAEDLLINGEPALTMTVSGNTFTFRFSSPPSGFVPVYFDVDHGITDAAGNPFDESAAGATWHYQLADSVPPTVAASSPPGGAAVRQLSEAQVTFAEPVTGVDAADLLVNGQPATNVIGSGLGPYIFTFPAAQVGAVNFAWAAGHDIRDLSSNSFAGGNWSVVVDPAAPNTVRINEILTANESTTGLADEDAERQDWIELYNYGTAPVNLAGWSLSNDPAQSGQWVLPAVSLNPGQYLVIFASGKDRRAPAAGQRMHTSFQLGSDGETLALFTADGPRQVASQLAYPDQRIDHSYGYDASGQLRYFSSPTPGTANGNSAIVGLVEPVHFSVSRGFFNAPFNLVLTTPTAAATIRYTTDGSPPTATSGFVYSGPVAISNTTPIRTAAFRTNYLPSVARTHTYIFGDQVLRQPANPSGFPATWITANGGVIVPADYAMDARVVNNAAYTNLARQALTSIPSLSIVMRTSDLFGQSQGIYSNPRGTGLAWERPASAEFLFGDGSDAVQVDAGYRIQGGSSREETKVHKHSQRLLFRGAYGAGKFDYPLFADSPVQSFDTLLVDAGLNLVWIHRTDATQRRQGQYVRDQFMSDLHNAMGWPAFHGRFFHLYLNGLYWGLHGIHERPDEDFAASYFGGNKTEWDILKNTTSFEAVAGDFNAWNAMRALANAGLANDSQYRQIQQYLDVPSLIDYMILNIYAGNTDWPHHNWYVGRRRLPGHTFKFLNWDAEHVLKDATYNNAAVNNDNTPAQLYDQLRRNNAEFRLLFADHVHRHFFNNGVCTTNQSLARYMARIREIDPAIVLESARWGDNAGNQERPGQPYERNIEWQTELNRLVTTWFPQRSTAALNQFRSLGLYPTSAAPVFNQHGGRVASGFNLTMAAPAGVIYYTTNGVDPRVYLAGMPAPDALAYSNAVQIFGTTLVKARARIGTNWSALDEATFTVSRLDTPLRIAEIMYNPPGGDAYEFLEIRNLGDSVLDLTGYSIDGVTFVFPPGSSLSPGAAIVLASDDNPAAFAARYPGVLVFGYFAGQLANGGERISIKDATGRVVTSLDYDDENGWAVGADGGGYSLEIVDPLANSDDPANWRASTAQNGSPGVLPSAAPAPVIVINEIMANAGNTSPDWIELRNTGTNAVNLTGWSLSQSSDPRQFVFPPGTTLDAGGYLLIWCDAPTNNPPGLHSGFALDRQGDNAFLYDANANRVDAISFGNQLANFTLGRIGNQWQLCSPTAAAANIAASTASPTNLFINEWFANASPGGSDWIELFNAAGQPISVRGVYLGTSNQVFQVMEHSFVPAYGFIQLFADELPGPGHLDFKLPATGGALALYDGAGNQLDRIIYGAQTEAVSQGRLPDGSATIQSFPGSVSPGASNYVATYSGPRINEVMARATGASLLTSGIADDWIELYNPTSTAFDLSGMRLGVDEADPNQWAFPSGTTIPGLGYLIVVCTSARPASTIPEAELNCGHGIDGESGGVFLFNPQGQLVDSVEFGFQIPDQTIGRVAAGWRLLSGPSPRAVNQGEAVLGSPSQLVINEWLSSSTNGADWFEVYNRSNAPVSLSGLFVTDDPSIFGVTNFVVGPLSFVSPNGWVRMIADDDAGQGRDHVSFQLDELGETLRLYSSTRQLIDAVDFGIAEPGVSEGRLPDGANQFVRFPNSVSPGSGNFLRLPNVVINEVLANPTNGAEQAIELYNPTSQMLEIGNWYLSNDELNPLKHAVRPGHSLYGGGYLVFYFPAGALDLNPLGGTIWLSEADAASNLSGFRAIARYGPSASGQSQGRVVSCSGTSFVPLTYPTFGADYPQQPPDLRTARGAFNAPPAPGFGETNQPSGPPVILEQPVSRAIRTSSTVSFSVVACGGAPMTYQWSRNGAPLSGATENSFVLGNASPPDVGDYRVVVSNTLGSVTSVVARLDFGGFPEITMQPVSFRTNSGNTATFQVGALNATTYQWRRNGFPVAGATNSTLVLSNVKVADAGYYNVLVGNAVGTLASFTATLTIDQGLEITSQPQSFVVSPGTNVTFAISALGGGELRYQWYFNSNVIAGATSSALTLNNVQLANHGVYWVEVTDDNGVVRSDPATLTVRAPPSIQQQPASVTAMIGDTVTFSVGATGTPPLGYRWRRNTVNVAFKIGDPTFTITNVQPSDAGVYQVVVTNVVNTVGTLSAAANLTVVGPPQLSQPRMLGNGSFEVMLMGSTGMTYAVERSLNLSNWVDLITLSPTNAQTPIIDPAPGQSRFYRARIAP